MHQTILKELAQIESANAVKILYACESGSRAWGFPSKDSDYDVRFIYVHPQDWYLSIEVENKRDVIERPISDLLDISGWDIRKALQLFRKSNPPLLEWLGSPIIYSEPYSTAQQMRDLAEKIYNPIPCSYHYLRMAQNNHREYMKGEMVKHKKYFYILRPLLAIKWLEQDLGVVPTEFQILVDKLITSLSLKNKINNLIERKKEGAELDLGPRIPEISDFISQEILRLEGKRFETDVDKTPVSLLDTLFQNALSEVWG